MGMSDHLMERFLSGDCTEEEKRQVMAFFKNNPERLAQYLTEETWDNFNAEDARYGTPSPQVLQAIEDRVGRAPVRKMRIGRMAAAAVILIICMTSLFYWATTNKGNSTSRPAVTAAIPPSVNKEEKGADMQTITNGLAKAKLISLPDGSSVKLAAGSTIGFHNPFINNRRDLFLKGEAVFTVRKDRTRPFTVHSKGIATTALGTVFSVNDKGDLFTTVHLYSGKVVIEKEERERERPFKNVYLLPGQQLILNNEDFSVQIKITEPAIVATKEENQPPQPAILQFAKQPLTEIFARLQKECKVSITYDPASMKNIDFTGAFDKNKETLESFLNTLCDLNDLTLKKTDQNTFSIQMK